MRSSAGVRADHDQAAQAWQIPAPPPSLMLPKASLGQPRVRAAAAAAPAPAAQPPPPPPDFSVKSVSHSYCCYIHTCRYTTWYFSPVLMKPSYIPADIIYTPEYIPVYICACTYCCSPRTYKHPSYIEILPPPLAGCKNDPTLRNCPQIPSTTTRTNQKLKAASTRGTQQEHFALVNVHP